MTEAEASVWVKIFPSTVKPAVTGTVNRIIKIVNTYTVCLLNYGRCAPFSMKVTFDLPLSPTSFVAVTPMSVLQLLNSSLSVCISTEKAVVLWLVLLDPAYTV